MSIFKVYILNVFVNHILCQFPTDKFRNVGVEQYTSICEFHSLNFTIENAKSIYIIQIIFSPSYCFNKQYFNEYSQFPYTINKD